METEVDDFLLEDIVPAHIIKADIFLPPTIWRLSKDPKVTETVFQVRLLNVGFEGERKRRLRLGWAQGNHPGLVPAISEKTITEWGAMGIACVLLSVYTNIQVEKVAEPGSKFDFWAKNDQELFGLEVSGTRTRRVDHRHRLKVRQLLDNPFGSNGFVVIVGFASQEIVFSYHKYPEEKP